MKTGKELHSLHGPVQSVRVETAELKEQDEHFIEEPGSSHSITFNRDGDVVEQISSKYIVTLMAPSGAPSTTTRTRESCWRRGTMSLRARSPAN